MTLTCRLCGTPLHRVFVDLGMSPLCESYVSAGQLDSQEDFYPLRVYLCEGCLLVQLPELVGAAEIFTGDYAYFSSYSSSWVRHAAVYVDKISAQLSLSADSLVVEVASNDGYLLQHFVGRGVPVLGIEPAENVARAAADRNVPTCVAFLGKQIGEEVASQYGKADLVIGNNVFAHVPDLRDFTQGLRALVADDGLVTLEFPHLMHLIAQRQYDTIYHEHFSYFSLLTASRALETAGLYVVDVEELATHGGSLRVYARPSPSPLARSADVEDVLAAEADAGLHTAVGHDGFAPSVLDVKRDLLVFLITASREGRTVLGYGAPGKGNTLLNHCGIRSDLLPYTVDLNPHKQGLFLPGTHIPIRDPAQLHQDKPEYIFILPWNLRKEIAGQLAQARQWQARFVTAIPSLEVF